MIYWIIGILVWLVGAYVAYKFFISKWDREKGFEIYASLIWPLTAILYGVRWISRL